MSRLPLEVVGERGGEMSIECPGTGLYLFSLERSRIHS